MSLIGRLENSVGVNLVEARIRSKSQCDSRKIEKNLRHTFQFDF
jgi:hypothetical protein